MVVMELILGLAAVGVREPAKVEERGGRREGRRKEGGGCGESALNIIINLHLLTIIILCF